MFPQDRLSKLKFDTKNKLMYYLNQWINNQGIIQSKQSLNLSTNQAPLPQLVVFKTDN